MNIWYLLAVPAWCILLVTAASRLTGMGRDEWSVAAHLRRAGLIGCAVAAMTMLATPFAKDGWLYGDSTWRGVLISWALAIDWITTPGMPPWWDFVLGVHRRTDEWKHKGLRARLNGEWHALVESFKPRRSRPEDAAKYGKLP